MLSVFAAVAAVLYAVVLPFVAPDNEDGGKDDRRDAVRGGAGASSSRLPPLPLETATSAAARDLPPRVDNR